MVDKQPERTRASVPEASTAPTKQARETKPPDLGWVEPSVWTPRMLKTLVRGVKGGKWFSLIDKVYSLRNLRSAFTQVKQNRGGAGVDHKTIAMFEDQLVDGLERLSKTLKDGSYHPQAIKRVQIPKPGSRETRPLGIPTVRDRVVQTALRNVLEPIFEKDFAEHSYGFRPNRGAKDALRRVQHLLKRGYTWVVDADLKSYFDTIPHDRLMDLVGRKVSDGRILGLIESFLTQEVKEGEARWQSERGTPQGAVISPLLSNLYLDPLDHMMAEKGYEMVRYADDFVILCRSLEEAQRALKEVSEWVAEAGLELHPTKTGITDESQRGGFDFLGYHFERGYRWPSDKSVKKLRDGLRAKTKRTNGRSLKATIADVNKTLEGWFEYFKHGLENVLSTQDKWVRMRLRSILRKHNKGKGRGRGYDHNRWPNAFFTEQGLFSLKEALIAIRSAKR